MSCAPPYIARERLAKAGERWASALFECECRSDIRDHAAAIVVRHMNCDAARHEVLSVTRDERDPVRPGGGRDDRVRELDLGRRCQALLADLDRQFGDLRIHLKDFELCQDRVENLLVLRTQDMINQLEAGWKRRLAPHRAQQRLETLHSALAEIKLA